MAWPDSSDIRMVSAATLCALAVSQVQDESAVY